MTRKVFVAGAAVLGLAAAVLAVSPAWADETASSASTYSTPAGESVTFTGTNTDSPQFDFCGGQTGTGFGMTLLFSANVGGADFVLPTGSDGPGDPGIGSFSWNAGAFETASVAVTIPADAVPGNYQVIIGCVTPGPGYLHPSDVAGPIDSFEITAPAPAPTPAPTPDAELPNTGADATPSLVGAAIAGIALVAGAGAAALRRRVTAKK